MGIHETSKRTGKEIAFCRTGICPKKEKKKERCDERYTFSKHKHERLT